MKKIAIVTVNYNTEDDTKELLKSLEQIQITNYSIKIIVIDNGSQKILELKDTEKDITVIRSDTNTGFSGGYNIGISEALNKDADYIMIVNNDTTVDKDILENLLEILESNEKIGVVTPKIYFAKGHEFHKDKYNKEELGKVIWFAGGHIDWANVMSVHRGVDEVDHGQYENAEKTDFASGCCMMFKREVLEKVGYFDEKYFLYYEDADLCERIKRAGYDMYYVPKASVYHKNASSSGGAGNKLHDYFLTRNQMLFGMKYAPVKSKLALYRQSLRLLLSGRPYQKKAIADFNFGKFGKGSFFENEEK